MKAEARAVLADLRLQSSLADTFGCKGQSSRRAAPIGALALSASTGSPCAFAQSYIQGQGAAAGRESRADCVRTAKIVAS